MSKSAKRQELCKRDSLVDPEHLPVATSLQLVSWHGGFRNGLGEGCETLASPTCQYDGQEIVHVGSSGVMDFRELVTRTNA